MTVEALERAIATFSKNCCKITNKSSDHGVRVTIVTRSWRKAHTHSKSGSGKFRSKHLTIEKLFAGRACKGYTILHVEMKTFLHPKNYML